MEESSVVAAHPSPVRLKTIGVINHYQPLCWAATFPFNPYVQFR